LRTFEGILLCINFSRVAFNNRSSRTHVAWIEKIILNVSGKKVPKYGHEQYTRLH
jgi:hypothetical protein